MLFVQPQIQAVASPRDGRMKAKHGTETNERGRQSVQSISRPPTFTRLDSTLVPRLQKQGCLPRLQPESKINNIKSQLAIPLHGYEPKLTPGTEAISGFQPSRRQPSPLITRHEIAVSPTSGRPPATTATASRPGHTPPSPPTRTGPRSGPIFHKSLGNVNVF